VIFQNGQFFPAHNGNVDIRYSSFIDSYVWGNLDAASIRFNGAGWWFWVTEQDTVMTKMNYLVNNCFLRSHFPIGPSVYSLPFAENRAADMKKIFENTESFIRNSFIESEVLLDGRSNLSVAQVLRIPSNYWGGDPEEQIKHDLTTEPSVKISGVDQYGPLIVEYEPQLDAPHPDTPSCGQ